MSLIILIVLASTAASYLPAERSGSGKTASVTKTGTSLQTEKKPPQDYMQNLLSRSTRPLGLKESKALNRLLEQSHIKWVIRSEIRHILN